LDAFDNLKEGDNFFAVKLANDFDFHLLDFALCDFPKKDSDKVMKLKTGDQVTIRGVVTGFPKFLVMADCELVNEDGKTDKP
jgi:hypothetical protein